jgi:DNA-binding response OmpR family regulator
LSLIISDTGIGIPSDRIDRIFDRFYKVNNYFGREAEGSGIGLALTKELVELYRGDIEVKSIVGEGTTFTLKIPVARDLFREDERIFLSEESHEPLTGEQYPQSEIKNKPVVLIVEDNIDLRNYISNNLGENYQILMAENGKSGLNLAIESIPDLIISDVMMPVMDGMEMCRNLKQDERTNHIPVIMLTAKAGRDSKIEGLETGADDYIIKPFDAEELQVRIRNLIQQRRELRKKFMSEFATQIDEKLIYSSQDTLLQKILDIIHRNIPEAEFNIDKMCGELNLSRTQLFNKVNSLTGFTPMDLLRTIRLKQAAILFNSGHKNVTQVMYQVGFNNPSYFARSFKELHKVNPSEYIRDKAL